MRSLGAPFVAAAPMAARLPAPARGVKLEDYAGTYQNRFVFELVLRDGGLILKRFGAELPVVPLGDNVFAVQAPGSSAVERFTVVPARGGTRAYAQMFLWTFPRTAP
jgi:hypothetical protein